MTDQEGLRTALATQDEGGSEPIANRKTPAKRADDIFNLIGRQTPQLARALPSGMSAERLARIAQTELRRNPELLACSPPSLLASLMLCAQLGLEPGAPLGLAYLVPYKRECTFILGYRGIVQLAYRSGYVGSIVARAVHGGDRFLWSYGLSETLEHITCPEPGELTHTYALARIETLYRSSPVFVVLTREEIEARRARSPAAQRQTGPWMTDYEAMARKTAVRALTPYLPLTAELGRGAAHDEQPVELDDVLGYEGGTE